MSTISNTSLKSLEERVYLEKATQRLILLLQPDPTVFYTHNPAILLWSFSSSRIPDYIRTEVISWLLTLPESLHSTQIWEEETAQRADDIGNIMRESLRRLAGSGSTSEEGMARAGNDTKRVRVQLLDGEYISVDVDRKARGSDLLDRICDDLDIVERDYFGVIRANHTDRIWLDMERTLSKTFRNEPWEVRFVVKFYPPEPSELRDDNTRYQLGLAVRNDIMEGRLTCSYITHALLASYILQCELGDREARVSAAQLCAHRALPQHALTSDVEDKIDELYRKHKGQTPAEAELNYLENAKKLSLYGAELHRAKDSEDVDIALAVCWRGIAVLRDMYAHHHQLTIHHH
ncbi:Protein 4.1-like [Papilio machaon]|uniref:Protein 4.1-like n=1 Tax=Papilio machaon TaxID=76193 RepID=A0A0N1INQ3_PAPMA|nr:Protein 4.1-like [Papilio machaon]